MAESVSIEIVKRLSDVFKRQELYRPWRTVRYEAGDEMTYEATAVAGNDTAKVGIRIDRFIGGGFAGQVYRVVVTTIEKGNSAVESFAGLEVGKVFAMKILIPPSGFSLLFRNVVYALGFQGPFQLQVNPAAARAGALWQKFIRRAAQIRFGREDAVNDIHVTFVDSTLGSCGELSDWVSGRTWRLEVDEHLDTLKRWKKTKPVDSSRLGSPEYRAKYQFMRQFVEMLHEMGAHEFARQYEWSTCKSQPNALKRLDTKGDPETGLVAVDFRAGLALLPFLPMSPGDFKLIGQGLIRGSLVQFDRGNLNKLEQFVAAHKDDFKDLLPLLSELKACEEVYRNSLPDVTHNHVRLFYDGTLWKTMLSSAVTGWRIRNLVDDVSEKKLRDCPGRTMLFFVLGLIPFLGRVLRKAWGRPEWRKHYTAIFTSGGYLLRAIRGRMAEITLAWFRCGRISEVQATTLAESIPFFVVHWLLSWIAPAGLHRFIMDGAFRKDKLWFLFVRPFKLYFNAEMRTQWMRDMVEQGKKKHILTDDDATAIEAQIHEPYIQKYLVSLVVHLMTLPVTQLVSGILALWFYFAHPDMDPTERNLKTGAILVLFQILPVSPGSLCRGLYTVWLAIKERDFANYNIALFLSFFKYVGYLAFPIQMTYRYPALARFMAGHWATDAVHIVPVFGERGALLERAVYDLCYNWPLTIRRRMRRRAELRQSLSPRYWPVAAFVLAAAAAWMGAEVWHVKQAGTIPTLWEFKYLTVIVSGFLGMAVTLSAGGAVLWRRILASTAGGTMLGFLATIATGWITAEQVGLTTKAIIHVGIWRIFSFTILTTIGAILTEILLPDPDLVR